MCVYVCVCVSVYMYMRIDYIYYFSFIVSLLLPLVISREISKIEELGLRKILGANEIPRFNKTSPVTVDIGM